ncbi:MAG: hypothetical protein COZ56_20015 [Armatimonadetes bacterium CG_4_8_14_3_um_filter_58_9]|nr:MAG: hypothetical protein COZ56_20015 [Armatimonadetes bacterium CG_4_8_14_3_um_filter_58_9]PJB62930.1 MAG: hypothetical protein CO095_17465 [Armatimonadetes bacterium CG_4_9_14_3_um_filter_58_7]
MPQFDYIIRDKVGKISRGTMDAMSQTEATRSLQSRGYFVSSLAPHLEPVTHEKWQWSPIENLLPFFSRIKTKDLAVFFRELYTMLHAGVSMYRALDLQSQTTANSRLREILRETNARVQRGEKLSDCLARHPQIFSKLVTGLVRAGETTGSLDTMCQRSADYLEKEWELRESVKRQTFYPKTLALAIIFIPTVPTIFVEGIGPWFASILKMIAAAAPFVIAGWFLWFARGQYAQTRKGKSNIDATKLYLPLFGKIVRRLSLAKFCRALSALYGAGIGYLQALPTAANACGNEAIAETIRSAVPAVEGGEKLSAVLSRSNYFHPMVLQMIVTGEETGKMDETLDKVADYFEAEAETALRQMTVALGPLLVLVGAGFVLVKVIGFYTNFYTLPME